MVRDEIDRLRQEITSLDDNILDLLLKRFALTDEIGKLKKINQLPVENTSIENKVLERLANRTGERIDPHVIMKIYTLIFEESKKRQKKT